MGIKFPTSWKTLIIKFPPPRDGKGVKCPGYARGGMLKLRFDRYISGGRGSGVAPWGGRQQNPDGSGSDRLDRIGLRIGSDSG